MLSDNLGKMIELPVAKVVEFGYYLGEEDKVLLPKGESPQEKLAQGDQVEVFIYKDSEDRLIATSRRPKLLLGEIAELTVASVGKIGAFLEWGPTKDLLLPYKEQTAQVAAGDTVLAALYIDKTRRLCGTMKIYPYLKTESPYQKNDEVTGRVYETSQNFGVFVAVDNCYSALIPEKEVPVGFKVGDAVKARVTNVHDDGKLDLSVHKKAFQQMDDDAQMLLDYLEHHDGVIPFTDKAAPEVIKETFGLSKNAFKRAVGKLLKSGKVKITEKTIDLL